MSGATLERSRYERESMRSSNVRVEIVETDAGGRQIAQRQRVSQALSKRRADIEAAVGEAIEVLSASVEKAPDKAGWGVSSVEGTFGISLTTDASVIVSKLSAQASLQVKIVMEPR